ncbi:MAG: FG-GAP-like repeat-containing protein [Sandaracinaceae bacterium]|nr:FG-GAP-like repeat-containing protein [Sandaracinaceae bacterium]
MKRSLAITALLSWVCVLGCDGTVVSTEVDAGTASTPCETPVAIRPTSARVAPRGVVILEASGGTGSHSFALARPSTTGGRVDERSGVFVAGEAMGDDEVVVRDTRCAGEARATITTTDVFAITPSEVELAPGEEITFTTSGGAGSPSFALARMGSGGSIDASGHYVAGASEGEDLVRATDMGTGATADAIVTVTAAAGLRLRHELVAIPEDAHLVPEVEGGSGVLDLASSASAIVSASEGTLLGVAPGRSDVTVTDHFTAEMATLRARTARRLEASSTYVGDRSDQSRLFARDVDRDGHLDAIVAMPQSSLGPVRGGAVLVYRGTEGGLEATPARVLLGEGRDDNFGMGLAMGDLDGDGLEELLVGAWQADNTGSNAGAVYVYRGAAGQLFMDSPSQILTGVVAGDRFGLSLAVGDLDGDGDADIVVGAADSEDRERTPRLSNQGSIFVFSNAEGSILATATQTIHGEVFLPDGSRTAHNELRFGTWMVSGDFDGDHLADVAVYATKPDPSVSDDGAVAIYRGRAGSDGMRGGLEEEPMLYVAAPGADMARSSRLGRALAMGDLDRDGRDELAIGQPLFDARDAMDASQDQTGAVRVFRGRAAGTGTLVLRPEEAELTLSDVTANLQIGYSVAIGDATGDGHPDLVTGDARLAAMGSMLSRPGMVRVFAGRDGALPEASPSRSIEGTSNEERFGWAVTPLVGGTGTNDRLVVYAGLADDGLAGGETGHDTGRLSLLSGAGALTTLPLPRQRGGRRLGQSVAALDLDDDGVVDLAVGAPLEGFLGTSAAGADLRGTQLGAVHVYRGASSGGTTEWPSTPTFTLRGFAGHSDSDQLGDQLLSAGDYDADGAQDLLVLSRLEDRASSQITGYALEAGCDFGTQVSDTSATLLFRGGAGVSPTSAPSLAIFGPEQSRPATSMATLDFDGDGGLDVAVGGTGWSAGGVRGGGVWIVAHRDLSSAMPPAVCAADWSFFAPRDNDDLGAAMVSLGDLDADGCDDLAVGAPRGERRAGAPTTLTDEGLVAIVFGAGASCASRAPVIAWLASGNASSSAGSAIAAGDLDGDGRAELVVGARTFRNGVGEIGRVFVFDGDRLAALRAGASASPDAGVAMDAGAARDAGPSAIDGGVLGGAFVVAAAAVLEGAIAGERLGTSLAITRYRGAAVIAMGAPWADTSGRPDTGGVRFARWSMGTLSFVTAAVGGEDDEEGTELGASMVSFTQGGSPYLVVGAPWSNVGGGDDRHEGAAYVVDLGD